jgi:hypothetical protein
LLQDTGYGLIEAQSRSTHWIFQYPRGKSQKAGTKALVPEVLVTLSPTFRRESHLKNSATALFFFDRTPIIDFKVGYVCR